MSAPTATAAFRASRTDNARLAECFDSRPMGHARRAVADRTRALLAEARANLDDAEAQLRRLEDLSGRGLTSASELDVARYSPLAPRGSVSQRELDNAVQNNLANVAAVAAARAAVRP